MEVIKVLEIVVGALGAKANFPLPIPMPLAHLLWLGAVCDSVDKDDWLGNGPGPAIRPVNPDGLNKVVYGPMDFDAARKSLLRTHLHLPSILLADRFAFVQAG